MDFRIICDVIFVKIYTYFIYYILVCVYGCKYNIEKNIERNAETLLGNKTGMIGMGNHFWFLLCTLYASV